MEDIIQSKRLEVEKRKKAVPLKGIEKLIDKCNPLFGFSSSLSSEKSRFRIIAEIKPASPSAGNLAEDIDVVKTVKEYERGGAAAISVLTEEKFFKGSLNMLHLAAKSSILPILRKDFIIDEYQIYESRAYRADAILLIASQLTVRQLEDFRLKAESMGMDALVEVHNKSEIDMALEAGAKIIGINNRNLHTLKTDISVTEKLIQYIPSDRIVVSESGIKTKDDILRLEKCGVRAFLIGELLMLSENKEEILKEFCN
ncbi:MAG: indole-3-glycerol phosphate synthase TrpC [Candidatus Schekmanbacteria bacterium]|nr:MAG: indole-3-glycerol phosphate synthase TrpC [Candidatus Schekmanbacteria bacterium]